MPQQVLYCFVLFGLCSVVFATSTVGYSQSTITSYNFMAKSNNSTLYNLTLSNDPYEVSYIYSIKLHLNHLIMVYYSIRFILLIYGAIEQLWVMIMEYYLEMKL